MRDVAALARTFEAVVFDWDGTAVPDRQASAGEVRARVEALCSAGVHVAVVSGTHVGNIDGQLRARPAGSRSAAGGGDLFLCLNRGSEVFLVGPDGPELLWRRTASREEDALLDEAAARAVALLADNGLEARVVSSRLNRRKIDLIPVDEWADPPKARIGELLASVNARLAASGVKDLSGAVSIAEGAAFDAGLADPRVTSDVKHVEVGLTDKSDSIRWLLGRLGSVGIGPGLFLIAGDEFGPIGGVPGSDSLMLVAEAARATVVSVGVEPEGVPRGVRHVPGGPSRFTGILDEQLARRAERRVPQIDRDPAWNVVVDGGDPIRMRVEETLLTVADGEFGTRGTLEEDGVGTESLVVISGVYHDHDGRTTLLPGPLWTRLHLPAASDVPVRRVLDLRTGVLIREAGHPPEAGDPGSTGDPGEAAVESGSSPGGLVTARFASISRPGTMAMRAEGPVDAMGTAVTDASPLLVPEGSTRVASGTVGGVSWLEVDGDGGGAVVAAAVQTSATVEGTTVLDRIVTFRSRRRHDTGAPVPFLPPIDEARVLARSGFDRLVAEQREAWARRWDDAAIDVPGAPEVELAVRFALFHLLSTAPRTGDAAVGARGLTGSAYDGHVFWDSDVFVCPVLAATDPAAALAMLRYRLRRLGAAKAAAQALGRRGARFPWESADEGRDVTPRSAIAPDGKTVAILTGELEEHIVADVAWSAAQYAEWTGDHRFLLGEGAPLLVETARYWESRAERDADGSAHLRHVIGPDEYHEDVDDNAFTNAMAAWNLRRAAQLVDSGSSHALPDEATRWRSLADELADGFDAATGRYEQFAGFFDLEPLIISEVAQTPVAADLLLGVDRVRGAQVVKQADVLMMHHLLPESVAPGSLRPNLDYYAPRTAHGSSLSPAIHASLLARAGRLDEALPLLLTACRLDLDDVTGMTAGGLHLATLGGVWQALVCGFGGIRPRDGVLQVDPVLPAAWEGLSVRCRFQGHHVRLHLTSSAVEVTTSGPVRIQVGGGDVVTVGPPGAAIAVPDPTSKVGPGTEDIQRKRGRS